MRQGNDRGTQYRAVIYTESDEQGRDRASHGGSVGKRLAAAGYGEITTEIARSTPSTTPRTTTSSTSPRIPAVTAPSTRRRELSCGTGSLSRVS